MHGCRSSPRHTQLDLALSDGILVTDAVPLAVESYFNRRYLGRLHSAEPQAREGACIELTAQRSCDDHGLVGPLKSRDGDTEYRGVHAGHEHRQILLRHLRVDEWIECVRQGARERIACMVCDRYEAFMASVHD